MKLTYTPTLDSMIKLYQMPRNKRRFDAYLALMRGDSLDDIALPLMAYNPYGHDHIYHRLAELRRIGVEEIMTETLARLTLPDTPVLDADFHVVFNVADDVHGGWTDHDDVAYKSHYRLRSLIKRYWCVPIFFASQSYSAQEITEVTREAVLHTWYQATHEMPVTLREHVQQLTTVWSVLSGHTILIADLAPPSLLSELDARADLTHWSEIYPLISKLRDIVSQST